MMNIFHNLLLMVSFIFLLFASLFSTVAEPLGKIEGTLFPVIDPTLTITEFKEEGDGTTVLGGYATKVRNCVYITDSMSWFLGTPDKHVEVPAFFRDPPQLRLLDDPDEPEVLEWEAIVVGLNAETLHRKSFATVQHDCGRPWPVTSLFYLSKEDF